MQWHELKDVGQQMKLYFDKDKSVQLLKDTIRTQKEHLMIEKTNQRSSDEQLQTLKVQVQEKQLELSKIQGEIEKQSNIKVQKEKESKSIQDSLAQLSQQQSLYLDEIKTMNNKPKVQLQHSDMTKLQNVCSLYASVSGIKWENQCEQYLTGAVHHGTQQAPTLFSIDSSESPFEIAAQLWQHLDKL